MIITLESAWSIWKLRCKRILGGNDPGNTAPTRAEAINTIRTALNDRLQEDLALTNSRKYGRKALDKDLVKSTWCGAIANGETLPDWPIGSEVLVGIPDPPRPGSPTLGRQ